MFLKFLAKQLRHLVFFGAIWPLHLGIQRELHTKRWFVLSSSMQLLFGITIMKLRQKRWRKCRRQQPCGPAGDGGTEVASTICCTNSSGHPWRTAGKSHSGTVSLDNDRYLTLAPNLRSTRASHDSQYTRYMALSDALKNSFFP